MAMQYSSEMQARLARILAVKQAHEQRLFRIPGVHTVGIRPKAVKGRLTPEFAIVVEVSEKKPISQLPSKEVIPSMIEDIKTDVIASPRKRLKNGIELKDNNHYSRLLAGAPIKSDALTTVSVEGRRVTTTEFLGTAGCVAINQDPSITADKKFVLLTCAHVLLDVFKTTTHDGSSVGQPDTSSICCFGWDHTVGHIDHDAVFNGYDPTAPPPNPPPGVDAGFATLDHEVKWSAELISTGIGDNITTEKINGFHAIDPTKDVLYQFDQNGKVSYVYAVHKRGARTGELRKGWVMDITASVQIDLGDKDHPKSYIFPNTIKVISQDQNHFGLEGDSGSAVLNDAGQVVGIYFSGADDNGPDTTGHSSAIAAVQNALKVQVADAATYPGVQTVPKSASVHARVAVRPEATPAGEQIAAARDEVVATAAGGLIADSFRRHFPEVRVLANRNKRVQAVWRRINGGQWATEVCQCLANRTRALPLRLAGNTLEQSMGELLKVLRKYASLELVKDAEMLVPILSCVAGRTYNEVLAQWRSGAA
jgi:hypothetical protein